MCYLLTSLEILVRRLWIWDFILSEGGVAVAVAAAAVAAVLVVVGVVGVGVSVVEVVLSWRERSSCVTLSRSRVWLYVMALILFVIS